MFGNLLRLEPPPLPGDEWGLENSASRQFATGDGKMFKFRIILKDEKGATAIEYGLIAALVAVAAITAMSSLGSQLNTTLTKVKTTMEASN
jgi:pilus assembly protein Flp/PilA